MAHRHVTEQVASLPEAGEVLKHIQRAEGAVQGMPLGNLKLSHKSQGPL
jgi:hypothetical protein